MASRIESIEPLSGLLQARVRPPGSKSITNRVLLLAALARGESRLEGVLDCDDTRWMALALAQLGVPVHADWRQGVFRVNGCEGRFQMPAEPIECGNSGTTIRFLSAALAWSGTPALLTGNRRMQERPIGDLVEALASVGAAVVAESPGGCPPVRIGAGPTRAAPLTAALSQQAGSAPLRVAVRAAWSSQYLSALMMAAPLLGCPVQLEVAGSLVSRPYVDMTRAIMEGFGVPVSEPEEGHYFVNPGSYAGQTWRIEPDASAAGYFFAAAAIVGGTVTVEGLDRTSLQGDLRIVDCLQQMGCTVRYGEGWTSVTGPALRGIECDLGELSDMAQTVATVALFVDGPTTIRGIAHNRVKETDRIGHLAIELRKLGAAVSELPDGLMINPGPLRSADVETWDDHRMAMSLALVGLRQPGIRILGAECVSKTFPDFFAVLRGLTCSEA